jgi:hypothetical protein
MARFLERARGEWRDLKVPYEDGQALHDLIVEKRFTHGLEIGTSTGHCGLDRVGDEQDGRQARHHRDRRGPLPDCIEELSGGRRRASCRRTPCGFAGVDSFLTYIRSRPAYSTSIERTSRSGISVSCRTR